MMLYFARSKLEESDDGYFMIYLHISPHKKGKIHQCYTAKGLTIPVVILGVHCDTQRF